MTRPIEKKDVVKVTDGKMKGKSGVVVRVSGDGACVVLTGVWDHGIWFSNSELKRCGRVSERKHS